MADIETRFQRRGLESFTASTLEPRKGQIWDAHYHIYEFVPRTDLPITAAPGAPVRR